MKTIVAIALFMLVTLDITQGIAHANSELKSKLASGDDLVITISDLKAGFYKEGDFYAEISLAGAIDPSFDEEREDIIIKKVPLAMLEKDQSLDFKQKVVITSNELKELIERDLLPYEHIRIQVQLGNNGIDASEPNLKGTWFVSTDEGERTIVNNNDVIGQTYINDRYHYENDFSKFTISVEMPTNGIMGTEMEMEMGMGMGMGMGMVEENQTIVPLQL